MSIVRSAIVPSFSGASRVGGLPWDPLAPTGLTLPALSDWSAANRYRLGANGEGIVGDALGFWVAALVVIHTGGVVQYVVTHGAGITSGWSLRVNSANRFIFRVIDGVGASIDSPSGTVITPGDGLIHLVVGFSTGTLVECYTDGVRSGTGTAIVGYTSSATLQSIGMTSGGASTLTGGYVLGLAGADVAVPTEAQIVTYGADTKATRALPSMAGVTTQYLWNVATARGAPTEWVEELGTAENFDETGSLIEVMVPQRWAF